jgi:DNA-binding CsgD family transcriptional regulator
MRCNPELLVSLVYSTYRTIHEPDRWSLILRELQRILRADACDLSVYDFRARRGEIAVHTGCYDQQHLRLYEQEFAALNPWMQRHDCYRDDGACWFGRQIVPHARLTGGEFYNGWLRPQGLFHRLSAAIVREDQRVVYVSVLRDKSTGSFQHEDREPLQRLVPHLRQALELYSLLIGPAALGATPLSEVASRLARAPDVLGIERELRLVDRLPEPTARPPDRERSQPSGKEGLRWWPIIASANGERDAAAAEPAAAADGNENRLARLYRLTAAEARLAQLLACGLSLSKAASLLDISMATVRTHLQRIFSKTFTHHQAQLVALLLLGPASLKVDYQPPEDDLRELG